MGVRNRAGPRPSSSTISRSPRGAGAASPSRPPLLADPGHRGQPRGDVQLDRQPSPSKTSAAFGWSPGLPRVHRVVSQLLSTGHGPGGTRPTRYRSCRPPYVGRDTAPFTATAPANLASLVRTSQIVQDGSQEPIGGGQDRAVAGAGGGSVGSCAGLPCVDAPSTPDDAAPHTVSIVDTRKEAAARANLRAGLRVRRHQQARRPVSHRVVAADQPLHRRAAAATRVLRVHGQRQRPQRRLAVRHQPCAWSRPSAFRGRVGHRTADLGVPRDGRDLGRTRPSTTPSLLLRGTSQPFTTPSTHPRLLKTRLTLAGSSRGDRTAATGNPATRQVAWPDGIPDRQRPLAKRGRRDASATGLWMRDELGRVDAVLCSPAERARQTWAHVVAELDNPPPATFDKRIYDAPPGALLTVVGSENCTPTLQRHS